MSSYFTKYQIITSFTIKTHSPKYTNIQKHIDGVMHEILYKIQILIFTTFKHLGIKYHRDPLAYFFYNDTILLSIPLHFF